MISRRDTCHTILFEDEDLIVVDKPEGVLSHPNPQQSQKSKSSFEGIYHVEERCFDTPQGRRWLIHRLDQDTSGVLLATKTEVAARKCRELFEKDKIQKVYLALVPGIPRPPKGVWRDHLGKQSFQGKVRSAVLSGRPPNAELRYTSGSILEIPTPRQISKAPYIRSARTLPPPPKLTLLELTLITGRTHQIRVQAASRRFPVAGDRVYGDFSLNRFLRETIELRRLFLHASRLEFSHPTTNHLVKIVSPLPESLSSALKRLRSRGIQQKDILNISE
jgi:23S rRNA-/tRNA-specific pseudouridylate synthase